VYAGREWLYDAAQSAAGVPPRNSSGSAAAIWAEVWVAMNFCARTKALTIFCVRSELFAITSARVSAPVKQYSLKPSHLRVSAAV